MVKDIDELCWKISLTGGERVGIKILEWEIANARETRARCLVGRIGDERKINKEAFKSVLSRLWQTLGSVTFKEIQENI